jgi:archaellum component FlaC
MKQLLKVTDHPNLYRDPHTKAIIVMDSAARTNYNNQKTLAKKTIDNNNELREEVNTLKNEISDIKMLLSQISNKLDLYK